MSHYKSNLRDIEFNLFEVLRRQDVMGAEPYEEFDEETARGILDEVNRLAVGPLAASFTDADRNPPVFDPADGSVQLPESFRRSFQAYMDAEWYRLDLPAEIGGSHAPRSLYWAVAELILGSTPAARPSPTCCGTSAPPSRRSSRCRPSSASGARPWC
jgi:alkylation response protein AidB-like acyl-CoA dehydrogenase